MTVSIAVPGTGPALAFAMQCGVEDNDPPGVAGRRELSVWQDRHEPL